MSRNRWTILFALFAARASVGFQFQTVASSTHVLRRDLGVGLEQIGVLIGVYFLTGLFLALPAGVIGARFGARTTVLAGLALMVAGSLAGAFSEVWSVHLAARMVAGAGGVLLAVTAILPFFMTVAFYGLELIVAVVQAYVFALLTCIYLNDSINLH